MLTQVALVAIGGGIGSAARFLAGAGAARLWGTAFPWGTLLINVLGSCVIGWFAARPGAGEGARAFVMAGLCGGFTTFSAFSLQTVELLQYGATLRAFAYVALSVLLCLCGTALGLLLAR